MSSPQEPPFLHLGVNRRDEQIYIGRARDLPPHFRGQLHRHTHYELMWLAQGESVFFSDFVDYPLTTGSMIFIRPGQLHTWRGDMSGLDLIVISFKPELLSPTEIYSLSYFAPTATPFLVTDESNRPLLDNLFTTLHQHYESFGENNRELLASYVRVLLTEAKRLYPADSPSAETSSAMQLTKAFHLAVEQRYLTDRTTQPYANLLGVTPNHLTRVIRQTSGMTPGEILRDRLTLEAKRLLAHTDFTVGETAQKLGFLSAAQFSNWFKREAGVSPDQFRRDFREA